MLIFISYPSDDKALAETVATVCREFGHEPFIAENSPNDLMGAGGYVPGLCATIDRSDAFILCLNNHSLQSHFQKREWNYAINKGKETPFVVSRKRGIDAQLANAFSFSDLYQWCCADHSPDLEQIRDFFRKRSDTGPEEKRFQWMQETVVNAGFRLTARYGVGSQSGSPVPLDDSKNCATNFDEDIERYILTSLATHYPGEPVLAEETVEASGNTWKGDIHSQWIWTVDSIDGTLNFLAGDDRYCCGIGLMHRGVPYMGAIFLPAQQLLFAGGVGRSATVRNLRDGSVQTLKADKQMTDLAKCWTLTHINSKPEEVARGFEHDLPRRLHDAVRRVWMWGCGLVSLTAVARGTHHLFAQRVIWPWDIVPGLALAHAAGAVSTVWPSPEIAEWKFTGALQSDVIVACNRQIRDAAAAALSVPGG